MPFRPGNPRRSGETLTGGKGLARWSGSIENSGWTFSDYLRRTFMKVLHLCKSSQGARWASAQARVLTRRRIEVHVALPDLEGPVTSEWIANGAQVHRIDYALSPLLPVATISSLHQVRRLVDLIQPDLIHSHHVKAAIMARLALRGRYP